MKDMKDMKETQNINVRDIDMDEHIAFKTICVGYQISMRDVINAFIGNLPAVNMVIKEELKKRSERAKK